jgi:hypothetical protein
VGGGLRGDLQFFAVFFFRATKFAVRRFTGLLLFFEQVDISTAIAELPARSISRPQNEPKKSSQSEYLPGSTKTKGEKQRLFKSKLLTKFTFLAWVLYSLLFRVFLFLAHRSFS